MADILGREAEKIKLKKIYESPKSELVAIMGRRRVGKTYTIRNYFQSLIKYEFTGIQNISKEAQLANFIKTINDKSNAIEAQPKTWIDAFDILKKDLETIPKTERTVLFFDELPWMAGKKNDFIPAFDHFWNSWASKQNIVIILAGSSAAWMNEKIINHRGGLHNRITQLMKMKPFDLAETRAFLQYRGINYTEYQIVQLYMAIGGIPLYLELLDTEKSVIENLNELCFKPSGFLYNEYNRLITSLFTHYEVHSQIIEALAKKRKGLNRLELLAETKQQNGGTFTKHLSELIQSDFIDSYNPFGKQKKETLYRLTDAFSLFHFSFILPNKGNKTPDFIAIANHAQYKAWAGYTFENIVLGHILQIKKALGISGISTSTSTFFAKPKDGLSGTQIDLLIERADNCINICEIKFVVDDLILDKEMEQNLRNKISIFNYHTKNRKHIFKTIITTFGLKLNIYSGSIDSVITVEALFEKI